MIRLYLSLLCALLLNGCQSTQPWYHPLDVSLKDNQPCFAVPINSVRSGDSLQNRGSDRLTTGTTAMAYRLDLTSSHSVA